MGPRSLHFLAAIDVATRIGQLKKARSYSNALRRSKHEKGLGLERVMEQRQHALLQGLIEVDQELAAGDQIEPRKGRIEGHIVPRENTHIP
ncbi:MAG: hypothetical protein QOK03_404 [Candidatus Binataceae bacterium]|nr:hypothetical protein [Candidatus Binataceae bacterium]